jgi:hypothetical protein
MKKFILILTMLLAVTVSYGQFNTMVSSFGLPTDTVTNTGTAFVSARTNTSSDAAVGVAATVTKISGTVTGTVILQGSLDGTNYYTISTDTLMLTDVASQGKIFKLDHNYVNYYRLLATGAGTMAATIAGKLVVKPQR